MKDELYINGQLIEIDDTEPVGFTYQVYSIADLTPQAAYSNTFNIPDTSKNRVAFNFSNTIQSNTIEPYRKLPCTYIRGGMQVIENGIAIIEGYNGNFQITVYASIFDFFSQLGDLTLKDIDWSELNHLFDLNTVENINNKYDKPISGTTPYNCFPIINWGGYDPQKDIDLKYQMPCIKLAYIIKKIFAKTTYSYSGKILSDGLFNDIAMTLSPDDTGVAQDILDSRSMKAVSVYYPYFNAFNSGPQQFININRTGLDVISLMSLLGVFRDVTAAGYFDSTAGAFYKDTVKSVIKVGPRNINPLTLLGAGTAIKNTANGAIQLEQEPPLNESAYISSWYETVLIKSHIWNLSSKLNDTGSKIGDFILPTYIVLKNGISIYETTPETELIDGQSEMLLFEDEFTCSLVPGDNIKIVISYQIFTPYQSYLGDYSYISITAQNALLFNSILNYNTLVPALKLKDILGCFCQQFALIISPSSNNILFTEFKEIKLNIPEAEDWTEKLDLFQQPSITYRIDGYAQINNLKWKSDDATNGFGDSSFSINDTVLDSVIDVFEMIYPSALAFNNIKETINQPIGGNTGIQIPRYTLTEADNWVTTTSYSEGDAVNYGGIIYTAIAESFDIIPFGNTSYWLQNPLQYDQTISSDSRLVLVRRIGSSGIGAINYTDGENVLSIDYSNCLIAWFSDPVQAYQLHFNYIIQTYWSEFVRMLNQLKVVECFIRLTDLDIVQLNFLTLKYISYFNNYFYLTAVEEYIQGGQSTKCNLIRM